MIESARRALAIRTMGCIRVERITEYLCEPLERALKDEDPYVRKTGGGVRRQTARHLA